MLFERAALTRVPPGRAAHARSYIKNDVLSVQESIVQHVEYSIGRTRYRFDDFEAYQARTPVLTWLARPWVEFQRVYAGLRAACCADALRSFVAPRGARLRR